MQNYTERVEAFISTFKDNYIDEAKLCFSLMSEVNLDIIQSELLEYIRDLDQEMEEYALYLPEIDIAEYYGSRLSEIKPDVNYQDLLNKRSKAQELFNISELCVIY